MSSKKLWFGVIGLASAAVVNPAIAESKLRISTFTPANGLMVRQMMEPWMALVKKDASKGFKFERYWGGTLGRNPTKQLKLVDDNVTDVAHVVPHYTTGRFPDDDLFNLPNMFRGSEEASRSYWRMYEQGLMRGFKDVRVLGVFTTGLTTVHTSKPVKSLLDIKGLKLRTSGAGFTRAARLLGAVAVPVPAPRVAENISRGLIDGAMLDWVGSKLFRVHGVTRYHVVANLGVITNLFVVNAKSFDALSAQTKASFKKHSGEGYAQRLGALLDRFEIGIRKGLEKDPKQTVVVPSAADKKKADMILAQMHDDWKKKNPQGEKLYAALQKILADFRSK